MILPKDQRRKKPWPSDALMIVASLAGTEIRSQMEGVHPAHCRDCGHLVHADTFSVRRAETHPLRFGRPVKFFCLPCHTRYEVPTRHAEFHHLPDDRRRVARAMGEGGLSN